MRATNNRINAIAIECQRRAPGALFGAHVGDSALLKICEGREVFAPLNRLGLVDSTAPMVNSSGAVSPAARATASSEPLTMPLTAAGQHHGQRDAGLGRAEGVAGLPQVVRHQPEHLVRGPDHDRQHQAGQRERAREAGGPGGPCGITQIV